MNLLLSTHTDYNYVAFQYYVIYTYLRLLVFNAISISADVLLSFNSSTTCDKCREGTDNSSGSPEYMPQLLKELALTSPFVSSIFCSYLPIKPVSIISFLLFKFITIIIINDLVTST